MATALIVVACVVVGMVTWWLTGRANRRWDAALTSAVWHADSGEWEITYDGVKWYVETENLQIHGELGQARALPFGHQAGLEFTLKLHHIVQIVRDRDVKKQWRARHGVVLDEDKSP